MKNIFTIILCFFLIASRAHAGETETKKITKDHGLVASWASHNPEDVVTVSNQGWSGFIDVIVSVSEGLGTITYSPIALICNGKKIIVRPNSGVACRTDSSVSWSSTDGLTRGEWSAEFTK